MHCIGFDFEYDIRNFVKHKRNKLDSLLKLQPTPKKPSRQLLSKPNGRERVKGRKSKNNNWLQNQRQQVWKKNWRASLRLVELMERQEVHKSLQMSPSKFER